MLFHGTSSANVDCIMKDGLKAKAGKGADEWTLHFMPDLALSMFANIFKQPKRAFSVYVTSDPVRAYWFARMSAQLTKTNPVIIGIDDSVKPDRRDEAMSDAFQIIGRTIPAKLLTLCKETFLKTLRRVPLPSGEK